MSSRHLPELGPVRRALFQAARGVLAAYVGVLFLAGLAHEYADRHLPSTRVIDSAGELALTSYGSLHPVPLDPRNPDLKREDFEYIRDTSEEIMLHAVDGIMITATIRALAGRRREDEVTEQPASAAGH